MRNQLPIPTEHEIQQLIINYLKYKGWYVQRLNSGRMPYEYGGKRKFMMLADKGTPDLMAFKSVLAPMSPVHVIATLQTRLVFVEVKRPGKKATDLQLAKMEELEKHGARCFVADSIESLEEQGL